MIYAEIRKSEIPAYPTISETIGSSYLLKKNFKEALPVLLPRGFKIEELPPYTIASRPNSYIELQSINSPGDTLRLGQSTALEVGRSGKLCLTQGSFLYSSLKNSTISLESNGSIISVTSDGTWISEKTPIGYKIISLEGNLLLGRSSFRPGELIILPVESREITSALEIELPLLLQTSKLLNLFSNHLPREDHLLTAAKVQSLRLKQRYDAFIGDITENQKLRVWSIKTKED
jgi:hypothetical protein